MLKYLVLLSLLITALFSPSFYSDNVMGNYDIFAQDGTFSMFIRSYIDLNFK